ncbi:uncharacterized protein LOC142769110 [Rhipicephalus microplus]|uniref:uncharacterized protein LOC142769110 n=1 Tax=Rhipicephalus microplus TaxID=6941 RepID=UPI003F6C128D
MSKASKKASKDHVQKRPSKTHHHRSKPVKGEVRPLVEAPVVEIEISEPEKSAYEHGLHRYLKEAPPTFQYKTEILTTDALPPERSCFRRNLPGILFASLVLLFTLVVFVELAADKGGAETNLFYPTVSA